MQAIFPATCKLCTVGYVVDFTSSNDLAAGNLKLEFLRVQRFIRFTLPTFTACFASYSISHHLLFLPVPAAYRATASSLAGLWLPTCVVVY